VILCDVNVLVYAHRSDSARHEAARDLIEGELASGRAFGWAPLAASGFIRIVTHPGIFRVPSDMKTARAFIDGISSRANAVRIEPGPRHWELFLDLCESSGCKGNLAPDAYLAALAIESGCAWATFDADFRRFGELSIVTPGA
jgi:uncharacterized protein